MRILVSGLCVVMFLGSAAEGATNVAFKRTQLDPVFRSEGAAVGDFNCDGKLDIAAGSVYYAAPDWRMHSILEKPNAFQPKGYSDAFCCFAEDVNRDGRTDLIVVGYPGAETLWYENPGAAGGVWERHVAVRVTNNETPQFADLLGDGRRALVCGSSLAGGSKPQVVYARAGEDPNALWPIGTISAPGAPGTAKYAHGLGVGDVNGDGRNDVVFTKGWWEAPADKGRPEWTFHQANLGEACANMIVYDFDGDGDNDVLSSSAHRFGIWWHEQTPDGWKTHEIDNDISQTHAVWLADVNGDGLPDFVTGKRWWAHGGKDPGADLPAMLVWFELQREAGRPKWTLHPIDYDSGVGTQFEVADVDGDRLPDVVTSNKKGVYYFQQTRK